MVTLYSQTLKIQILRICETFFYVIILIGCLKDEGYQSKVTFNAHERTTHEKKIDTTKKYERNSNNNSDRKEHWIVYYCCHCCSGASWFLFLVYILVSHRMWQRYNQKKRHKNLPSVAEIINFLNFLWASICGLKFTFTSILLKIMERFRWPYHFEKRKTQE